LFIVFIKITPRLTISQNAGKFLDKLNYFSYWGNRSSNPIKYF